MKSEKDQAYLRCERLEDANGGPPNAQKPKKLSNPVHQAVLDLREGCKVTRTVTEVDAVKYGMALRQLRLDAGITLRGMAKMLNLSPPFLSDCELGHRNLKLGAQIAFVEACNKATN